MSNLLPAGTNYSCCCCCCLLLLRLVLVTHGHCRRQDILMTMTMSTKLLSPVNPTNGRMAVVCSCCFTKFPILLLLLVKVMRQLNRETEITHEKTCTTQHTTIVITTATTISVTQPTIARKKRDHTQVKTKRAACFQTNMKYAKICKTKQKTQNTVTRHKNHKTFKQNHKQQPKKKELTQ